jgi:hypothetical protein
MPWQGVFLEMLFFNFSRFMQYFKGKSSNFDGKTQAISMENFALDWS